MREKKARDSDDMIAEFAEVAAGVGFRATPELSSDLKRVLSSFQTNLLALFSHELRTPLMGVRNALLALETPALPEAIRTEMFQTAVRNAEALSENLDQLLALADLESGVFQVRLREIGLKGFLAHWLESQRVITNPAILGRVRAHLNASGIDDRAVFLDPARMQSFLSWTVKGLQSFIEPASLDIALGVGERRSILVSGNLPQGALAKIREVSELVQLQMSMSLKSEDAFLLEGALRSEDAFLTRTDEGLGLEWRLAPVIAKRHGAEFEIVVQTREQQNSVELKLSFPNWNEEEAFRRTLEDRLADLRLSVGSFGLVMLQIASNERDESKFLEFRDRVKRALFRTRDRVFVLRDKGVCALLLDDCKSHDIPHLVRRLEREVGESFRWGSAHAPEQGYSAEDLIGLALKSSLITERR